MYNKIITAVDFSGDCKKVVDAALSLANNDVSKLHLVHIVEPIAAGHNLDVYAQNYLALQDQALEMATQRMAELGADRKIQKDQLHTVLGLTTYEIRALAVDIGADVIVIGSHGHSGWKLLLGSTANKLLHGASCDVLTVHVGDN